MTPRQRLLRADTVDRQLQRTIVLRRAAQFVVDDAKRAVAEQIDSIRLRSDVDGAVAFRAAKRVDPLELVLEQALEDRDPLLDLERERTLGEPARRGGTEQEGALERAVPLGQRRQVRLGHRFEQLGRLRDVVRRDRPAAAPLPLGEKAAEDLVDELSAFQRREPPFVVALFREPQDARRKVFERALEIPLEVADAVRLGPERGVLRKRLHQEARPVAARAAAGDYLYGGVPRADREMAGVPRCLST